MKNIVLIIGFLICFKPAFPFMEYALNYEYISKVLCVNKDQVELNCNGKCYLMSKIAAETENNDASMSLLPLEFSFSLLFLTDIENFETHLNFSESIVQVQYFKESIYFQDYFPELIKPPIL